MIIGIGEKTLSRLDVLPVIRAVKKNPAVIVVAEEDSLDLERSARQRDIFYCLVHPIDRSGAEAVLHDVTRRSRDEC